MSSERCVIWQYTQLLTYIFSIYILTYISATLQQNIPVDYYQPQETTALRKLFIGECWTGPDTTPTGHDLTVAFFYRHIRYVGKSGRGPNAQRSSVPQALNVSSVAQRLFARLLLQKNH